MAIATSIAGDTTAGRQPPFPVKTYSHPVKLRSHDQAALIGVPTVMEEVLMGRVRLFAVAACAAAVVGVGASAAFAGEITGSGKGGPNGDGTPGGTLNASSACAFSGLDDGAATPGTVQNYGHRADDPFFGTVVTQKGASSLTLYIHPPGAPPQGILVTIGCNPHAGLAE